MLHGKLVPARAAEIAGENVIKHPAMSPGFNIIEDRWSYQVRKLEGTHVSTLKGLQRKLQREWASMPWSEVRKSVDSIGARLRSCIKLKGRRTKY